MEWKKYEDILFKDVICKHDSGEISEALGLTAEEYKRLNEAVAEFMGELDKNGKMSVFAEEFMKAPKMLQVGSLIILKQIANDFFELRSGLQTMQKLRLIQMPDGLDSGAGPQMPAPKGKALKGKQASDSEEQSYIG